MSGEPMTIKELKRAGFRPTTSFGTRRIAESVADKLRDEGQDTAVREDQWGNHVLYTRQSPQTEEKE